MIFVLHENGVWVAPLRAALAERGLPFDEWFLDTGVLDQATRFASFDVLAAQEAEQGFREKGSSQARFFRRGAAGQWRETLPPAVVARIEADHGDQMRRHGYLPS